MEDEDVKLIVKDDSEATNMFSSFLKTKDIRFFNSFMNYINNKKFGNIKIEVENINDLFYLVNGKTILELMLVNDKMYNYKFFMLLANNISTLFECIRLKNNTICSYVTEKTLMSKLENGETLFDYLLNNNLLTKEMIESVFLNSDCITKIKNKDEGLLMTLSDETIFNSEIDGIKAIDYLFEKNLITIDRIKKIGYYGEIYDLCLKYHREDLLPYLPEIVLKNKRGNKTIFELLIEKKIYPIEKNLYNDELKKVAIKYKLFDYFVNMFENSLLFKYDGEKTILEFLLENGITPKQTFYKQKESLDIMMKYKKYDIICSSGINNLLKLYDLNNTYLDIILEEKKNGYSVSLSTINTYQSDSKELAKYYTIIAKHGYMLHVELTEERLTRDNGELLKELLSIDKDLTFNVILSDAIKKNIDVAILLRMNGIEQKSINLDLHSMNIVDEYYEKFNSEFSRHEINEEGKKLLSKFRELMLSDGESDEELVEAVISSYTYLIASNNEYGIRELKKLIEIKQKRKEFSIKREKNKSYFSKLDGSIHLENTCLNTINHEIGHALFHTLSDENIPSEYEQIINEIRTNPIVLKKVQEYSSKFYEIRAEVISIVEEKYMKAYHIDEKEKAKIEQFLNTKKEELKKSYLEKGYDEQTIDTILSNIYSMDEYIEQDKRIKKEQLVDAILRSEYGAFITVGDILDSIFIGKFKSKELFDNNNYFINSAYGHGIAYYDRGIIWSFDETMANYSGIIKSIDGKEIMAYLRSIVGEKFVNCIESYYRNQISLSTKDLSIEEEKKK